MLMTGVKGWSHAPTARPPLHATHNSVHVEVAASSTSRAAHGVVDASGNGLVDELELLLKLLGLCAPKDEDGPRPALAG